MICTLMAALKGGDLAKINRLIAADVDVDQQDERGVTALQLAVQHGYYDIAKSLLLAGANPNIKNKIFQDFGNEDSLSIINNNNESNNNKKSMFDKILQELQELGSISALHIAIKFDHLDVAKLLLMYGADPNIADSGNCTPLHWAAVKGFHGGAQLLLENKADPNIQDLAKSTALHEAVRKGNIAMMRLLLEKNADPNIPDIAGETAYQIASEHPHLLESLVASSKYVPSGWNSH